VFLRESFNDEGGNNRRTLSSQTLAGHAVRRSRSVDVCVSFTQVEALDIQASASNGARSTTDQASRENSLVSRARKSECLFVVFATFMF
jgi:hypothetical protein